MRPLTVARTPFDRALSHGAAEAEPVLVAESLDASGVDLEAISCADGHSGRRVGIGRQLDHVLEVLLEPGWRDDFEDARRLIARVPEGMPLPAGLEDQVAGLGVENFLTKQRADASF